MANLREIRNRIKGVKNTAKITSAMKMVSAAKLKRAQDAIEKARPYAVKMKDVITNLVGALGEDYSNPLTDKRPDVSKVAVVIIGSDRGLCGSFNANLFKEAARYLRDDFNTKYPNAEINVITVGKKSTSFFKKSEFNVIASFPDVFAKLNFDDSKRIVDTVKDSFVAGEYDRVLVYVNEFINVIKQEPTKHQLLPIQTDNIEESDESSFNVDYIFEPNQASILDTLLPKMIDISMWRFMLESNAAEQAARMMAMDNATTNAKDLVSSLNLQYNKMRQAAITTEMLEIVGGANALEDK